MWERGLSAVNRLDWRRLGVASLLVLALCCIAAGCGAAGAKEHSEVTLTVPTSGYPEEKLLREIYAQALEAVGFKVERRNVDPGIPSDELENGRISGYPDYLDTALTEVTPIKLEGIPGPTKKTYEEAKRELGRKGLVPFPPASYVRTNAVGLLKKTAEERDLKTLPDLKGSSREMSVKGEYYCRSRADCLGGLERRYGIVFETFSAAEPPPRLYEALRTEETDAVMLVTTEGRLARRKNWLVLLEDDQHRLPAANPFWLTRQDVVDEAGPDYEKAILEAQKGLTLRVIRELNAEVEFQGKPPAKVAAEYLKSIHYGA